MFSTKPLPILLAEDDPDDRLLTEQAFRNQAITNELHFVEDGVELLDYLHHRGKYAGNNTSPRPGLILLDLNMPRKDGREALAEIKTDPDLKSIPVIVLTTSKASEDIQGCYDHGANSYITKPGSFSALATAVKVLMAYWFEIVRLPTIRQGG